jgi:hypothetical protein
LELGMSRSPSTGPITCFTTSRISQLPS